jgi:hypothetical protein
MQQRLPDVSMFSGGLIFGEGRQLRGQSCLKSWPRQAALQISGYVRIARESHRHTVQTRRKYQWKPLNSVLRRGQARFHTVWHVLRNTLFLQV